jgi:hypothetical protein
LIEKSGKGVFLERLAKEKDAKGEGRGEGRGVTGQLSL